MFICLCLQSLHVIAKAHSKHDAIAENLHESSFKSDASNNVGTAEKEVITYEYRIKKTGQNDVEEEKEKREAQHNKLYEFLEDNNHDFGAINTTELNDPAFAGEINKFVENELDPFKSELKNKFNNYDDNDDQVILTTETYSISSDFNAKDDREKLPESPSQWNVSENSFTYSDLLSFNYDNNNSNNINNNYKNFSRNVKSFHLKGKRVKSLTQSNDNEETLPQTTDVLQGGDIRQLQNNLLNIATDFGLSHMHYLYDFKEQEIYNAGFSLPKGSPATYLAAFNQQSEEVKKLSRFGYAALKATARLRDELTDPKLRQNVFNVTDVVTNNFPEISLLDTSLHDECPIKDNPNCPTWVNLFRTIDGTCNNLKHLWWGSRFQPLKRFLAPHYSDGLEAVRLSVRGGPLPSPRLVSTEIHWDRNVNSRSVTHMFMQWGQFIDHDMTSSSQSRGFNGSVPRCCSTPINFQHPDCLPIEVPQNDNFFSNFGIRCLEFLRSAPASRVGCSLGPREQINQVTSYIDGSMIYGNSEREAAKLRLFRNGMLKYSRMPQRLPLLPQDRERGEFCRNANSDFICLFSGDGRMSEQPGLMAVHVVFLRLHNRLARHLSHLNPHWQDERLYQETRKIVGAILQHITYREFLPIVLGQDVMNVFGIQLLRSGYYNGYSEKVNGAAANAFATAAFRFGHSMVQGRFLKWDDIRKEPVNNVSLHDELQDPESMHRFGAVDNLIMGMCIQEAQKRDEHFTVELTNHLFQTPRFPAGLDLAAINIQRGRDHGLPSYNAWRNPCGLRKMKKWDDLLNVMSGVTRDSFRRLYREIDDIDLFPAGLSEFSVRGGIVGSTFACIIAQHFRNLRKGDRFWYENGGFESSFSLSQLRTIRRVTLARILCDNLDLMEEIQPFVFLTEDNRRNPRMSCKSREIPTIDLSPWIDSRETENFEKIKFSPEDFLLELPESSSETTTTEIPNPIN